MDKRQRHNLLLILAASILLIGVIVQLYFILTAEQKSGSPQTTPAITQENNTAPAPQQRSQDQ